MALIFEGIALAGLGTYLVVQTIRGKIKWGQIWDNISKQEPKTNSESGSSSSSAEKSQQWLDQQSREQRAFLDNLNRQNNQWENQFRAEDSNRFARTGYYR